MLKIHKSTEVDKVEGLSWFDSVRPFNKIVKVYSVHSFDLEVF